jgi:hypothetical protein
MHQNPIVPTVTIWINLESRAEVDDTNHGKEQVRRLSHHQNRNRGISMSSRRQTSMEIASVSSTTSLGNYLIAEVVPMIPLQ